MLIALVVMPLTVVFTLQTEKWMNNGATTVAITADFVPRFRNLSNVIVVEVADLRVAYSAMLSKDAKAVVAPDASNPLGVEVLSL